MKFTWDPKKSAANERKHGISFEEALMAFEDPLHLTRNDEVHSDRMVLVGVSGEESAYCHRVRRDLRGRDPHHQRSPSDGARKESL